MSSASGKEAEVRGWGTNRYADMNGVPVDGFCTIAVWACVQLVQSEHTGGQLVVSVSSGHGSRHTDANAIPPSKGRRKIARSITERPRPAISASCTTGAAARSPWTVKYLLD